jgi:hypothetical protein
VNLQFVEEPFRVGVGSKPGGASFTWLGCSFLGVVGQLWGGSRDSQSSLGPAAQLVDSDIGL